jgi:hypothetical protein
MTIDEIIKKYHDKWVLARVIKEDATGKVLEAEPIISANKRDQIDKKLPSVGDQYVTVIYTGEIPPRI